MTTRYLENNFSRCQTVSAEGRCTNAVAGARACLSASMPVEATTGEAALTSNHRLRAVKAMRRVVAAYVAVEHHAFRLRHQHATPITLDHCLGNTGAIPRSFGAVRRGLDRLFAQALEQHPAQCPNDQQKNYFSHFRRPCVWLLECDNCVFPS